MSTVSVTTQMLNGDLGSDPVVDVSFDLYLDGGRPDQAAMSIDLITGATISSFACDTSILKAARTTTGDYAGRLVTFTPKDRTRTPPWATVRFSLEAQGAPWSDDRGNECVFALESAGLGEQVNISLRDFAPDAMGSQLTGGMRPTTTTAPHRFATSGALLLSVQNVGASGNTTYGSGIWSALRLTLHDAAALTASDIRATYYTNGNWSGPTGATPAAAVHLGPHVEGLRFADIVLTDAWFEGTQEVHVVIEAPILKYLLAWDRSDQITEYAPMDSRYHLLIDPRTSYASGYRPHGAPNGWVTLASQRIGVELSTHRGVENLSISVLDQVGDRRFDVAWGNPEAESNLGPHYRHMPHAVRNVQIAINSSPTLTSRPGAKRSHFS